MGNIILEKYLHRSLRFVSRNRTVGNLESVVINVKEFRILCYNIIEKLLIQIFLTNCKHDSDNIWTQGRVPMQLTSLVSTYQLSTHKSQSQKSVIMFTIHP